MNDPLPSEAVVTAWARLLRAQAKVLGAVETTLKQQGFPPLGWYDVLLELRRADGGKLRPVEIEGHLLLAQHNVSRLIDRLTAAGYVERRPHPEDGRSQEILITEAGRELLRRMWPVYASAIERHVGAQLADETEAELLSALLGKLIDSPKPDLRKSD
jgi:DNA-binding MarR family transcriptional regulator